MKYTELNEKKQHGSADFPIQYYHLQKGKEQYVMPLHWHKEFEIIRIISGTFTLYIQNVEYVLHDGDIAFIGCGLLHRGDPKDCVYECIVFDLNMLRRRAGDRISPLIIPIMSGEQVVTCLLQADDSILYSTIISLFNSMNLKDKYYEFTVYGLLFRMFSLLYSSSRVQRCENNKKSGHRTEVITSLIDWIEAHYTENITLKKLSVICGMNEKYLCHLFREFTNRTPIDFINNLRIESACHEMTVNHRTVTEAAFDSGFNDLSYFSRTFKKHKGVTPKRYTTTHFANSQQPALDPMPQH